VLQQEVPPISLEEEVNHQVEWEVAGSTRVLLVLLSGSLPRHLGSLLQASASLQGSSVVARHLVCSASQVAELLDNLLPELEELPLEAMLSAQAHLLQAVLVEVAACLQIHSISSRLPTSQAEGW